MRKNSEQNLEQPEKEKEMTSIATVVSFDGSSSDAYKIVMLRCVGSQATSTTLASITGDGMKFIRTHGLNKMFETSGLKEIAGMMGNGGNDDQ